MAWPVSSSLPNTVSTCYVHHTQTVKAQWSSGLGNAAVPVPLVLGCNHTLTTCTACELPPAAGHRCQCTQLTCLQNRATLCVVKYRLKLTCRWNVPWTNVVPCLDCLLPVCMIYHLVMLTAETYSNRQQHQDCSEWTLNMLINGWPELNATFKAASTRRSCCRADLPLQ